MPKFFLKESFYGIDCTTILFMKGVKNLTLIVHQSLQRSYKLLVNSTSVTVTVAVVAITQFNTKADP